MSVMWPAVSTNAASVSTNAASTHSSSGNEALRLWRTAGRATATAMKSSNIMTVARLTAASAPQRLTTPVVPRPAAARPGTVGTSAGVGLFVSGATVFPMRQRYLESAGRLHPAAAATPIARTV